jgi:hypothetical protein
MKASEVRDLFKSLIPHYRPEIPLEVWADLRLMAERNSDLEKRIHDLTGEHKWLDVTSLQDAKPRIISAFCDATRQDG